MTSSTLSKLAPDARGNLSRYALACGYIQQTTWRSQEADWSTDGSRIVALHGAQLTLWNEGGPCYHVRAHDFDGPGRLFWESFDRLCDARAFYRRKVAQLTRIYGPAN
jgi:hypothetical protein